MNTCILLTTCVNIKTQYFNKYNTPDVRLNDYIISIKKWIANTNLDIFFDEKRSCQRIYISDRRDSTPLRLPNICPPNLSPRLLCQTVR